MAVKKKVYLVQMPDGELRTFSTWPDCEKAVKGTPLKFAGGLTYEQALNKLRRMKAIKPTNKEQCRKPAFSGKKGDYPTEGLCSDGGTRGNPGQAEYQVSDIIGNTILHKKLGVHSNNYAELAGIGAMVKYAIQSRETHILWTDSKIAMGWIQTLRIGQAVRERAMIVKMATIIKNMLQQHPELQLKKWKTRSWGEIPADFGRKS
ncbi:MAG: hypothetical protein CSA81_05820 [Acidobacteria bacterium]|nr:MAG: hypothetical protein CSA81_05820 [Acidobacteriota bacterium]